MQPLAIHLTQVSELIPAAFFSNTVKSIFFWITPTPADTLQPAGAEVGPPIGWVVAGFLVLLLAVMIYQNIKSTIKRILKPKKRTSK